MSNATPLTEQARRENYARMNGHPYLTARQRRRIRHKSNRMFATAVRRVAR